MAGGYYKKHRRKIPLVLAYFGFIPLFFYGLAAVFAMLMIKNVFFILGGIVVFLSALAKTIYKYLKIKEDIYIDLLSKQIILVLPCGIFLMIFGILYANYMTDLIPVGKAISTPFAMMTFVIGITFVAFLLMFIIRLTDNSVKSIWIKEVTNVIAQVLLFVSMLVTYLNYPLR